MTDYRSDSRFSLGLVLGLILGTTAAVLLLPQKKTRSFKKLKKEVKIPRRLIAKPVPTSKKTPQKMFKNTKRTLA